MDYIPLIIVTLGLATVAFSFYKIFELTIRWMAALDARLMDVQAMTQRIEKHMQSVLWEKAHQDK